MAFKLLLACFAGENEPTFPRRRIGFERIRHADNLDAVSRSRRLRLRARRKFTRDCNRGTNSGVTLSLKGWDFAGFLKVGFLWVEAYADAFLLQDRLAANHPPLPFESWGVSVSPYLTLKTSAKSLAWALISQIGHF